MVNKDLTIQSSINSRVSDEFYQLLVNSIQDYAIFILDPTGCVASWNIGAEKLKGYTQDEIIGKHFSTFYSEDDIIAGKPEKELEDCQRLGRLEDEGWRIKKDGTRFWANVIITAIYNHEGALIGYAKVTRDLTERKKHENELERANKKLHNQHIRLSALNESKDEFISLASHQLRTPASGTRQFIGLLLEGYAGPLNEKQTEYLKRANESNNRQIELVNDMLRVAQVDAGRVLLNPTPVNMRLLVKDVIGEQRDAFKNRQQKVTYTSQSDIGLVNVDKMRFRMVLENLLDNAGKYTPDGGRISVRVHENDTHVIVEVADTGVGIDEISQAKLFSKFSRIHNKLSDSVGGSGLGLYWAKKIINLHGGTIDVHSELNKGTTFVVSIPKESQDD